MKMWIPGKNGLLGSDLLKKTNTPYATDKNEVDISKIESLRAFVKSHPGITHIVNCAAFSLVDPAETRQDEAFQANVLGPENLGRIAQEIGARVIHISSDYVYPGNLRRPLKETDPVMPLNFYGETKLEGEKRLLAVLPSACILRVSWLFGLGGKNFVSKLLEMFKEKEEISLTDDQWGRPTYASDLAEAILEMLNFSGIYHYANHGPATKFTFGVAMREMAIEQGFPVRTKKINAVPGSFFPSPCKRPPYSVFDTSKIEKILKTPIRPWQDALKEFLCKSALSIDSL